MNIFIDKHIELLKELIAAKVDFILIGGYSVIYHGYRRTTGDLDLLLKPDNENKPKLISALRKMKVKEITIENINKLDFTDYLVISIWAEPEKVDFLTRINLVSFEQADKNKIVAEIDGVQVPIMHLNDLVLSKFNTDRLKDKLDVEELQKVQKYIMK